MTKERTNKEERREYMRERYRKLNPGCQKRIGVDNDVDEKRKKVTYYYTLRQLGFNYQEIGKMVGITPENVKNYLTSHNAMVKNKASIAEIANNRRMAMVSEVKKQLEL